MNDTAVPVLTVMPLRFSADPSAMIRFLVDLGMVREVTAGDDGFGELIAGAGRVMVHRAAGSETGAAPGTTDLCFSVPDVAAAARALTAQGAQVRVWDEAYGKQGSLRGPAGEEIALNGHQRDLYGYRGHGADGAGPDARLAVAAVRACDDRARDLAFFERLGFRQAGEPDEWWTELSGPDCAGVIGLHRPAPGEGFMRETGSEFGDVAVVRLGFETDEDLDSLAARLRAAGHADARTVGGAAPSVHVTDPDGCHVEIHLRPKG